MSSNHAELLKVQQAAKFLSVGVSTIRRWAQQGTLVGIKVGSRGDWRFKEEDLLKLTKSNDDNRLSPLRPRPASPRGESEASKKQ